MIPLFENLEIASPFFFFLLVPLFLLWVATNFRRPRSFVVPDTKVFPKKRSWILYGLQAVRTAFIGIGLVAIVAALAGVSRVEQATEVSYDKKESRDIIVILDVSGSMTTTALGRGILEQYERKEEGAQVVFVLARDIALQLLKERPYDRFGLLIFGSDTYLARTFSSELQEFTSILGVQPETESFFILSQYANDTKIGNALHDANRMFADSEAGRSRAVLLISDLGDSNPELTVQEIWDLIARGVKVYVFVVNPHPFITPLVKETFRAQNAVRIFEITSEEELAAAKRSLDQLEPSPRIEMRTVQKEKESLHTLFLIAACVSLFGWVCAQIAARKLH